MERKDTQLEVETIKTNSTSQRRQQINFITYFAILLGLEAIFCFVLGSITIGTGVVATLMMIPIMITAIFLGPKAGALMGFFGGLFSFIIWTFFPPASSVATAFIFTPFAPHGNFWSLVTCFGPRILAGWFSGLVYQALKNKPIVNYSLAAAVCSLTNTILVCGLIIVCFSPTLATIFEMETGAFIAKIVLLGLVVINGTAELIISVIITGSVYPPLKMVIKNNY